MTDEAEREAEPAAPTEAEREASVWITDQIRRAMTTIALGITEPIAAKLALIEERHDAELGKRNKQIEALQVEVAKLGAEVARVRLAQEQAAVDRDRERREWTPPLSRRELN
jgi:hypothetical protein